jgi:hypothetical protein
VAGAAVTQDVRSALPPTATATGADSYEPHRGMQLAVQLATCACTVEILARFDFGPRVM